MSFTKTEVKQIAITAPLTGFVTQTGTPIPADSILIGIEKNAGTIGQLQAQIGALTIGINLFNYYNFK